MNRKETKQKFLSENRFGAMIFLLRMAGIPCKMKRMSTVYAIYMVTVTICFSATYLGVFGDVYVRREDLGTAMATMRALFTFIDIMWIFSKCR